MLRVPGILSRNRNLHQDLLSALARNISEPIDIPVFYSAEQIGDGDAAVHKSAWECVNEELSFNRSKETVQPFAKVILTEIAEDDMLQDRRADQQSPTSDRIKAEYTEL